MPRRYNMAYPLQAPKRSSLNWDMVDSALYSEAFLGKRGGSLLKILPGRHPRLGRMSQYITLLLSSELLEVALCKYLTSNALTIVI